ncbi:hypothetical protein MTR_1g056325 [Medicago truncatula]|uniref:Uncharacterized protein n=1 Tax=Medicago truncatula TaxID=3880 RepID=A0A072VKE2_MEDTR|nr:hypothetical protein MTR_1g056325 [Medicago truncatula]
MCLYLACITGLEASALALKLSHHKTGFLCIGSLSSASSDLSQGRSHPPASMDTSSGSTPTFFVATQPLLELLAFPVDFCVHSVGNTFPADFAKDLGSQPRLYTLSSVLVVQSASKNPAMSRSIDRLMCKPRFVVPWRYLNILFIPYHDLW